MVVIFVVVVGVFVLIVVLVVVEYLEDVVVFDYLGNFIVYEWVDDFCGKMVVVLWCQFVVDIVQQGFYNLVDISFFLECLGCGLQVVFYLSDFVIGYCIFVLLVEFCQDLVSCECMVGFFCFCQKIVIFFGVVFYLGEGYGLYG